MRAVVKLLMKVQGLLSHKREYEAGLMGAHELVEDCHRDLINTRVSSPCTPCVS